MRAIVTQVEAGDDGLEVTCEVSEGDPVTALCAFPPGITARPVAGDVVVLYESGGEYFVIGCIHREVTDSETGDGGVQYQARDSNGNVVCQIVLGEDGNVEIKTVKSGGVVTINGVTFDEDGAVKAPAEITATAATGQTVGQTTHQHGGPMGPTQPPIGST